MAAPELAIPRETAEAQPLPREVAEERTFTEQETYAVIADRVARETAALEAEKSDLQGQVEALQTEKASLQDQLDVAVAAKEKAEQDFVAYKAEQAQAVEVAARKEERTAKVREAAKHLKDEFFTTERADRWAAMETEQFDAYVAELAAVSEGVKTEETPKAETAAAQTSMSGAPVETKTSKTFFDLLGRES